MSSMCRVSINIGAIKISDISFKYLSWIKFCCVFLIDFVCINVVRLTRTTPCITTYVKLLTSVALRVFPPQPDEPPLWSHDLSACVPSHHLNKLLDMPRLVHVDRLWLQEIVIVWKLIWPFSLLATVHVHLDSVPAAGAPRWNNSTVVSRPGEVAKHMLGKEVQQHRYPGVFAFSLLFHFNPLLSASHLFFRSASCCLLSAVYLNFLCDKIQYCRSGH